MPVVFRRNGFRFHIYSNEGNPREPSHVHVTKDGADAKVWLSPMSLAYNEGFDGRTERWILSIVEARRSEIEDAWNEHFS